MGKEKARFFWAGILALSFSTAHAQTPQQIIQQAVDAERTADQNDHSNWIFLEESDKPKEHIVQWVATTQQGSVERVLEKDEQRATEAQQQELIQKFLHDTRLRTNKSKRLITTISRSMTCSSFCPPPSFGHKQEQPQRPPHCTSILRQASIRRRARHACSAA